MLPPLNERGLLPQGIYPAELDEVIARFGRGSARRIWLAQQLQSVVALARTTGRIERVFLFGSFVSGAQQPHDLDMLLVVSAEFDLEAVSAEAREVFDHARARTRFHADILWTKASVGEQVLSLWLETYQRTRDFAPRGIIEVVE